jgi:hypothetical protein
MNKEQPADYADAVKAHQEKKQCMRSAKPNSMTFKDADGNEYSIHIPLERYDEALDYFVNENWDELKKFDEWCE